MTEASRILTFRKRDSAQMAERSQDRLEVFPRFRKEWNKPMLPIHSAVPGFSIPPVTSK